jgi:hypothetical protein
MASFWLTMTTYPQNKGCPRSISVYQAACTETSIPEDQPPSR